MLTQADDLKKAFTTGAVPKEDDFHQLIELADQSRQMLGLASGTDAKPLEGLDNTAEKLALKVDAGLMVGEKVKVKVREKSGIAVNAGGLGLLVDANSSGLAVGEKGLSVNRGHGLEEKGNALAIKTTPGLKADANGVAINLAQNAGLDTANGLKIKLAQPEKGKENYLTVSPAGLALSEAGIKLLEEGGESSLYQGDPRSPDHC